MLRITSDLYSGRPNPSWVVEDENRARALLDKANALRNRTLAAAAEPSGGLGFRGFLLEPLAEDLAKDFSLESSLWIPASAASDAAAKALIDELRDIATTAASARMSTTTGEVEEASEDESPEALWQLFTESITTTSRGTVQEDGESAASVAAAPTASCRYELAAYNPAFWNNNATIRSRNNCYNYASNKRTDTFAQPGRGCGNIYRALTCPEVTRAALCDRLHRRYDCFPDTENPRYLVALVIWPNRDFHWYRRNREGYWSHKPGSTPVRNTDNSGHVIRDPATCDRGPYTQFCGYFYTCRSQLIR